MKNRAYLSLGSNLGDRLNFLTTAILKLKNKGLVIEKISSIYETAPQNFSQQPNFLNCVLLVGTELCASDLLNACQEVEKEIGKHKTVDFGPRNIDIDILTFNSDKINTMALTIPHQRMLGRNFVLTPLQEISPEFVIDGKAISNLVEKCSNQSVRFFSKFEIQL